MPAPPAFETGRSVAVVGSGPAGLAAAQQLRRAGHGVVVFERDEAAGGLVRFGVPGLQDREVDRRAARRAARRRGRRVPLRRRRRRRRRRRGAARASSTRSCSRPARACRATCAVPGRELAGTHFAMEYLYARNRWAAVAVRPGARRRRRRRSSAITAAGKHVVVIGGGDTGADCVGHALREGARSVAQLELVPEPPPRRPDDRTPWPRWPNKLRLSYAMKEAQARGRRRARLLDRDDAVQRRRPRAGAARRAARRRRRRSSRSRAPSTSSRPTSCCSRWASWTPSTRRRRAARASSATRAATSTRPRYATSVDGVFAAGDARRGQSLIVWAINEGRQCARAVETLSRNLAGCCRALEPWRPCATALQRASVAGGRRRVAQLRVALRPVPSPKGALPMRTCPSQPSRPDRHLPRRARLARRSARLRGGARSQPRTRASAGSHGPTVGIGDEQPDDVLATRRLQGAAHARSRAT